MSTATVNAGEGQRILEKVPRNDLTCVAITDCRGTSHGKLILCRIELFIESAQGRALFYREIDDAVGVETLDRCGMIIRRFRPTSKRKCIGERLPI